MSNQDSKIAADLWIHRSEGMRCRTCIWFVEKVRAGFPTEPVDPISQRV
jgi:hypothetical protein